MNGGFAASAFSDSAFANYAFDFDDYAVYVPGKWNADRAKVATQRAAEIQTAMRPDDAVTERLLIEPSEREIRYFGERPVALPTARTKPITGTRASR